MPNSIMLVKVKTAVAHFATVPSATEMSTLPAMTVIGNVAAWIHPRQLGFTSASAEPAGWWASCATASSSSGSERLSGSGNECGSRAVIHPVYEIHRICVAYVCGTSVGEFASVSDREEREHGLAVPLKLGLTDAGNAQQRFFILRPVQGERAERRVTKHHVAGHSLLAGLGEAPFP